MPVPTESPVKSVLWLGFEVRVDGQLLGIEARADGADEADVDEIGGKVKRFRMTSKDARTF